MGVYLSGRGGVLFCAGGEVQLDTQGLEFSTYKECRNEVAKILNRINTLKDNV